MRERSRLLFAVGLATGVVLLSSVPASAALCARWEIPAPAVVGRAVDVGFNDPIGRQVHVNEEALQMARLERLVAEIHHQERLALASQHGSPGVFSPDGFQDPPWLRVRIANKGDEDAHLSRA